MSTHNIPFSIKKRKVTLSYPKSAAMGFFLETRERVRNSHGKRAISVRAIEVLHTYTHTHIYIYIYIYIYVCVCVCMYVCMYVPAGVSIYIL